MVKPILPPRRLSRLPHTYFHAWKVILIAQGHIVGKIYSMVSHRTAQQRPHYRSILSRCFAARPIGGFVKT